MTKYLKIGAYLSIICIALFLFTNGTSEKIKKTSESYQIKAVKIPNNLTFAGERVPLENQDVLERVDREFLVNIYWQSNTLLLIKRAHKYFPIIEPILAKNGIPDDFKYLAVIESGLQNVTSGAGAKGFWQIMSATAKEHKLEVNDNVDERYHIEKATQAACDYLNRSKKTFNGNWTLTAAAYNAGNTGILRQINKQQVTDYYDLLLVDETSRYVPRIIAVKEILSNSENYGFVFEKEDLYKLEPTKIVTVDTVISDIATFAKNMNTNYKELKNQNPWLRENQLNNASKTTYEIKIPQ